MRSTQNNLSENLDNGDFEFSRSPLFFGRPKKPAVWRFPSILRENILFQQIFRPLFFSARRAI
jgi:hypothetical protein